MVNINEFKELFLKLTEYEIPFGYEPTLEKYLPAGFKKDSVGNYFYEIEQSETLFTTHLDTYSKEYNKINHVIKDYTIGTDKETILGGDNKLGTAILINMINEGKLGTYYFFLGEEPFAPEGGLYGSKRALAANPNFFKKFKRCIAFDRREYGSIVTRQMGRNCCSMEFATELAKNMKSIAKLPWDKKGGYGYYTDTAVFMDVIPEITNLSAGGFKEHHKDEWVNLKYTYAVLQFALKMDWESLPTVRELEEDVETTGVKKYNQFEQDKIVKRLRILLDMLDLPLTRNRNTANGRELTFSKWLEDVDLKILINDENNLIINGETTTYAGFEQSIIDQYGENIIDTYDYYYEEGQYDYCKSMFKFFGCKNEEQFYKKMGYEI